MWRWGERADGPAMIIINYRSAYVPRQRRALNSERINASSAGLDLDPRAPPRSPPAASTSRRLSAYTPGEVSAKHCSFEERTIRCRIYLQCAAFGL